MHTHPCIHACTQTQTHLIQIPSSLVVSCNALEERQCLGVVLQYGKHVNTFSTLRQKETVCVCMCAWPLKLAIEVWMWI